jgi:hypothetical protein
MTKEEAIKKVTESGFYLKELSDYSDDKDVAMIAVEKTGHALDYCSENLKNDFDIVLTAVKNNGRSIEYASENLKQNKDIQKAAIDNRSDALDFIESTQKKKKYKEEKEFKKEEMLNRFVEDILKESSKIAVKYKISQTDALILLQIIELKSQNKQFDTSINCIDDIDERLSDIEDFIEKIK